MSHRQRGGPDETQFRRIKNELSPLFYDEDVDSAFPELPALSSLQGEDIVRQTYSYPISLEPCGPTRITALFPHGGD